MELMHTMRGVDDAEILARIKDTLSLLHDIIDTCEDRYATRLAEREASQGGARRASTAGPAARWRARRPAGPHPAGASRAGQ
jgi:hypothetical protein